MSSTFQGEVLIADADASIRALLSVIVERTSSRKSVLAGDGPGALELLRNRRFDAVIIDLFLPELGGAAVLEQVSALDGALLRKVVILTTAPKAAVPDMPGVAAVIRKPFALDELQAALERCYSCH
jgi:DNA-binding NtrC family response regulator